MSTCGILLAAGGAGSRMGKPKALVTNTEGQSWLHHGGDDTAVRRPLTGHRGARRAGRGRPRTTAHHRCHCGDIGLATRNERVTALRTRSRHANRRRRCGSDLPGRRPGPQRRHRDADRGSQLPITKHTAKSCLSRPSRPSRPDRTRSLADACKVTHRGRRRQHLPTRTRGRVGGVQRPQQRRRRRLPPKPDRTSQSSRWWVSVFGVKMAR